MVSSLNTTSGYGVNNRTRAYSNTAKLDTVPNKPYTNTNPAIDSNKNALLYQLIQQLKSHGSQGNRLNLYCCRGIRGSKSSAR